MTLFTKLKIQPNLAQTLIILGVFILCCLGYFFLVKPYEIQLEKRLQQYPAQRSHLGELQRIIQKGDSPKAFAPVMNESEFEVLKLQLNRLGIQPNVFKLSNSNEPKIEIQINALDFSTWLQLVDNLRRQYRLYTDYALIEKASEPGTVNISATMVQKR